MVSQLFFVSLLSGFFSVSSYSLGNDDVVFHLFTRTNPTVSQPLLPSVAAITASSFSIARRTVITIHSYDETVAGNFNAFVVNGELNSDDVNVIAVDWSRAASPYTYGLASAPQAGQLIANFVDILTNNFYYNGDRVRIVGAGLGGHVAGIAARHAQMEIPHVVALDPSLVGWTYHPDRLSPNDATLVEVLHTTSGLMGYDFPLGHIDFYPNGGAYQNGCGAIVICSHQLSYIFYAESLTAEVFGGEHFIGQACGGYGEAVGQQCFGNRDVIFGGRAAKTGVSGIYTFKTNTVAPYAQG